MSGLIKKAYFDFTKFKPMLLAFPKPKFSPARIHLTLLYFFSKSLLKKLSAEFSITKIGYFFGIKSTHL